MSGNTFSLFILKVPMDTAVDIIDSLDKPEAYTAARVVGVVRVLGKAVDARLHPAVCYRRHVDAI